MSTPVHGEDIVDQRIVQAAEKTVVQAVILETELKKIRNLSNETWRQLREQIHTLDKALVEIRYSADVHNRALLEKSIGGLKGSLR